MGIPAIRNCSPCVKPYPILFNLNDDILRPAPTSTVTEAPIPVEELMSCRSSYPTGLSKVILGTFVCVYPVPTGLMNTSFICPPSTVNVPAPPTVGFPPSTKIL